jgi:putative oxidoreductase
VELAEEIAKLLARVSVSGLLLFHGAEFLRGDRKIHNIVKSNGLPEFLAYGAVIGEVIAPICAILGIYTRIAGLLMASFMFMAVVLYHSGNLFKLSPNRDAYYLETQVFFFVGAVVVALLGAGRFSLGIGGVWN